MSLSLELLGTGNVTSELRSVRFFDFSLMIAQWERRCSVLLKEENFLSPTYERANVILMNIPQVASVSLASLLIEFQLPGSIPDFGFSRLPAWPLARPPASEQLSYSEKERLN